ncbi:cyclase family protein [Kineobactrum salinum]|uniref:Cyclase family protein n=1 Tax=Kineobactrum salinum TaxID=2708301 RepID=A0A6C0TZ98_9GAMM|nr:cyclase family protein [Kineobactrum salinum]QIB65111.1 cyclase family protein [Kineobactrum salinum]
MDIAKSLAYIIFTVGLAAAIILPVAAENPAQSKWGEHDTLGSANYLSPELALQAAELIVEGKVYALGVPVGSSTPAVAPRTLSINVFMPGQYGGATFGSNEASYLDDMITGWLGIGTQIDSLAHAGKRGVFYNGNKAIDFVTPAGVKKLGIEDIPPIVTRGVLIDIAAYRGVDRLDEGQAITGKELDAAAKSQGVEIREGDVVVVHTGWLSMLYEDPERFVAGEPGLDVSAAQFLVEKGVVAVGADNWGVEVVPFKTDAYFDVHVTLLADNGTYILELLDTRELAADKTYEFMFVLGQPRYIGAIQAVINPVAIR